MLLSAVSLYCTSQLEGDDSIKIGSHICTSVERQRPRLAVLKQLFLKWVRRQMGGLRRGCFDWHTLTRTVPPCPREMLSPPTLRVTLSRNITSLRRRSPNFPTWSPSKCIHIDPWQFKSHEKCQWQLDRSQCRLGGGGGKRRRIKQTGWSPLEGASTTKTTGWSSVSLFRLFNWSSQVFSPPSLYVSICHPDCTPPLLTVLPAKIFPAAFLFHAFFPLVNMMKSQHLHASNSKNIKMFTCLFPRQRSRLTHVTFQRTPLSLQMYFRHFSRRELISPPAL